MHCKCLYKSQKPKLVLKKRLITKHERSKPKFYFFVCLLFNEVSVKLFLCDYEVIQENQDVTLTATEPPHQWTSIMGFQVSKITGPSKAGRAASLCDNSISKGWVLHLAELAHNAQARLNARKRRCMIPLWFLEGNSEFLLILLLTAQGIKSFHRITRFVIKHSHRILFFQCIIKTCFDGSHTQSYFAKRNDSHENIFACPPYSDVSSPLSP